ncbi:MAG: hypothetical protein HYX56_00205 [Chloroflexi bacterium]|nr:hypothetical protein [Chloroflexota bacterium]
MTVGILTAAAILGGIALIAMAFLQRGREGVELSPAGLLRLYLYIASLAGVVVFTIGLASVVNFGIARVAGDEFIYGGQVFGPIVRPACPPGTIEKGCVEPTPEQLEQQRIQQKQQTDRRRNEDLIRGITFAVFGALFWVAHYAARRGLGTEGLALGLRRVYLLVGTIVFGLATVVLLPTGVYQALANALLATPENYYRQGADSLGGGIVTLPIWLMYLRLVVGDFRRAA